MEGLKMLHRSFHRPTVLPRQPTPLPPYRPNCRRANCFEHLQPLESRILLFSIPVHFALTTDSLPFLNTQTVAAINAEHLLVDTAGAFDADNHVDSCHFVGGVANI